MLRPGGAVWCTGSVHQGSATFTAVPGLPTVTAISGAAEWSGFSMDMCALADIGTVTCWASSATLHPVPGVTDAVALSAGANLCLVRAAGRVSCADNGLDSMPAPGSAITDALAISSGSRYGHVCVVRAAGSVTCWGPNGHGALGLGSVNFRTTPQTVSGGAGASTVQAFRNWNTDDTCHLRDGDIHCLATPSGGGSIIRQSHLDEINALGTVTDSDGTVAPTSPPIDDAVQIVVGDNHTCVLTEDADKTTYCWGSNYSKQITADDDLSYTTPQPRPFRDDRHAVELQARGGATCARTIVPGSPDPSIGVVDCWGSTYDYDAADLPMTIEGTPGFGLLTTQYALGRSHLCILTPFGTVSCRGYSSSGAFGNGQSGVQYATATHIPELVGVTDLWAGDDNTCFTFNTGQALRCTGANNVGQLGVGDTPPRAPPRLLSPFRAAART